METKKATFNVYFRDEESAKKAFNSGSIGDRGAAAGWLAEVKGNYAYLNSFLKSSDPVYRKEGISVLSEIPYYATHYNELVKRLDPFFNDPDLDIQNFVAGLVNNRMSDEEKEKLQKERDKAEEQRKNEKKLMEKKLPENKPPVFSSAKIRH